MCGCRWTATCVICQCLADTFLMICIFSKIFGGFFWVLAVKVKVPMLFAAPVFTGWMDDGLSVTY